MGTVIVSVLLFALQDAPYGPPGPPETVNEIVTPAPAAAPAESRIAPLGETSARKLVDRPETELNLTGFVLWTLVVMALLVGTFLLLRRFGRRAGLLPAGGMINVLARKSLSQKQDVFLVEVGTKVFLIGSTRDHLNTLGEFSQPDDVAVLRAHAPGKKGDSLKLAFRDSLREGLREAEDEAPKPGYASIVDELAEIKRTVRAWRA